jgi:hypothetical protein
MKTREIKIMSAVLRREIGRSWPLLLLKSIIKKPALFKSTHWEKENSAESRYVSRLAPIASLYRILSERVGRGEAFRIVSRMAVPIGVCEQWDNLRSLGIEGKRGIERLRAFYDFMGEGGSGQFVTRELVEESGEHLHYEVQDCPFARFFAEVGMLELATLFCKVDKAFFPSAIPDYEFSRGNSWGNTSAYRKEHCVFSFKKKRNPPDERYIRETPLLDYTQPAIQILVEELDLPYRSDREKISHFYEYVRREIRPVRHAKKRKPASTILRKHRGDDIAKTVLFMALLRAGGIPCRARFAITGEGIKSWADIYCRKEWVSTARWTDDGDGASADPVGWEKEYGNAWNESLIDDQGVFDSPDDFLEMRSVTKEIN